MQGTFEIGEKQGVPRGDITGGQSRRHTQPAARIFTQNGRPHVGMADGADPGRVGPRAAGGNLAGIVLFDV